MVVRRTQRVGQKLRSLPQWWQGDRWQTPAPAPPLLSPPDPEGVQPRPIRLSEAQREQITTELEAVQAEVQRLRDRASALEIQLGLTPLSAPLEGRLGTIASRLSPDTDTPVAAVAPLSNPGNPPGSATTTAPTLPVPPLLQVRAYRVTLPSDLLFTGEEGILQPSATQLLDSILVDVGRYPGATILVGSYTDPQGSGETGAEVSFQQAIAVQRYLSARLGEDQYRWLAVGYGHSGLGNYNETPLTRRIAIAIVPPS
jgi:outer membrane protein OmpA-like peptidoglycan-associated protein